jgi:hypothetical protein
MSDFRLGSLTSPFFNAHSYGSSSSYQTAPTSGLFNPYVAGTSHSFSGLDVCASQALDNVGGWVEPSVEPIIEVYQEDGTGAMPIPIPQTGPPRFSNTFSSRPWTDDSSYQQSHLGQLRAVTIPRPQIRISGSPSDYRMRAAAERHPALRHQSQHGRLHCPSLPSSSARRALLYSREACRTRGAVETTNSRRLHRHSAISAGSLTNPIHNTDWYLRERKVAAGVKEAVLEP